MPAATILVVDDNPTNLKLVCYVLQSEGHAVLQANNAREAQLVLSQSLPALILMDIQMPDMDGLSLTRIIKADPVYRGIPVIALTSFAMKGDEEKARAAGCDGYITKPIDTAKLLVQIDAFLQRGPPPDPSQVP